MADERPTFMPDEADAVADEPIDLPEHLQAEQPLPPRPEPTPARLEESSGGGDDARSDDDASHAPGSFLAGLTGAGRMVDSPEGEARDGGTEGVVVDTEPAAEVAPESDEAPRPEPGVGEDRDAPHPLDDDAKLAILLRGAIVAGALGAIAAILALTVAPEQLRISGLLLAAILSGVAVSMGHVGHRAERMGQRPQEQLSRMSTITGYAALGVVVVAVLVVLVPLVLGPTAQGQLRTAQELAVGQCVADPYATWDDFQEEIGDDDWWFDVVPCTQRHFGEVSLVNLAPTFDEPTTGQGESESLAACIAGFETYVGTTWESSSLSVEDYYPTGAAWEASPYVVCVISSPEPMTGMLAGSGL